MKITRKKSQGTFNPEAVEIREPLVEDLIAAERITGKTEGYEFAVAVISQVATFDGRPVPPEEVRRLPKADFLSLLGELDITDAQTLPSEPSTSSGKENSAKSE